MALPSSHLVSARVFHEQTFMAASVMNYVTGRILGSSIFWSAVFSALQADANQVCFSREGNLDGWPIEPAANRQHACLLACRELPYRGANLSQRQSAVGTSAQRRRHQAAASGPLGHDERAELHLDAFESADQRAKPEHD